MKTYVNDLKENIRGHISAFVEEILIPVGIIYFFIFLLLIFMLIGRFILWLSY